MKNILCFGDSNTFGYIPNGGRYIKNERWTGILQNLLGDEFYIIEEGLGGRTTVFDDPINPYRNGAKYLPVSLLTHQPIDLVILALGTNDCKHQFSMTPGIIARGIKMLCEIIKKNGYAEYIEKVPEILILSPIHINEAVANDKMSEFGKNAAAISRGLAPLYEQVAKEAGALFLDLAKIAKPSKRDNVHMEKEEHQKVAEALAVKIKSIW